MYMHILGKDAAYLDAMFVGLFCRDFSTFIRTYALNIVDAYAFVHIHIYIYICIYIKSCLQNPFIEIHENIHKYTLCFEYLQEADSARL